jgi:hypothetical protein
MGEITRIEDVLRRSLEGGAWEAKSVNAEPASTPERAGGE